MEFTIRGKIGRRSQSITWRDGLLSGDEVPAELIRLELEMADRFRAGQIAQGHIAARSLVSDPLAVRIAANEHVFDSVLEETGELPSYGEDDPDQGDLATD